MYYKYCILIHYHEISIKGDNRKWFENILINNIKKHLVNLPYSSINLNAARIFCFGINIDLWSEYVSRLNCIMGVRHSTKMIQVDSDLEKIKDASIEILKGTSFSTFRVSAKRQYKDDKMTSQQLNVEIGAFVQKQLNKKVDLENPDINIIIEIVKGMVYIGYKRVLSYGGLPVGSGEEAISLISSGIDSPVASFEMIKRGVKLSYMHFHSAPATNRQSIKNVEEIIKKLVHYQIDINILFVPILEIQKTIMENSPNKFWIILFRRAMIHLACKWGFGIGASALITGENVGQVASQTLSNIRAIDDASMLPIIRPLAGYNKDDIVNRAKEIGTYEISIEPYQDCCSFFVPVHPATKSKLNIVKVLESKINFNNLFSKAIDNSDNKLYNLKKH
tara:strand:+ start:216 stop:1391 length:1176 start_codon:yes stop_codon:yes gene_type:complete